MSLKEVYRGMPRFVHNQHKRLRRRYGVGYGLRALKGWMVDHEVEFRRVRDEFGRAPGLWSVDGSWGLESLVWVDRDVIRALGARGIRRMGGRWYLRVKGFENGYESEQEALDAYRRSLTARFGALIRGYGCR